MRKTLYIITAIASLILAGCVKDPIGQGQDGDAPEGKATLTMNLCLPESTAATKAMGDTFTFDPSVDKLKIAIFGASGFLKEYVEATDVELAHAAVAETATTPGTPAIYSFYVVLSLDANARYAHVIINGPDAIPFLYEDEAMSDAYTEGGKDAYWQRLTLPTTGITAKKEWNSVTQSDEYVKVGDEFVVSDEVQAVFNPEHTVALGSNTATFNGIEMIRNYAKITVEVDIPVRDAGLNYNNQFELDPDKGIYVVNAPTRGSVAPYNTTEGKFMTGYGDLTYADMLTNTYPGYMPNGTTFDSTVPADYNSFKSPTGGVYLYERTKPKEGEAATYVLIYGNFYAATSTGHSSTAQPCYYKIDLSDANGYYTIFRNFRYKIKITGVAKKGSSSAGDAASTGGSGDISSSNEVKDLNDISNGYCRILVQYTDSVIVNKTLGMELKYKFLPSAASDTPANGSSNVTITVNPGGTSGDVLANTISTPAGYTEEGGTGFPNGKVIRIADDGTTGNDSEGWRSILFDTTDPGALAKTQVIRITGTGSGTTIFRDITLRLMSKQAMTVKCQEPTTLDDEVEDIKGSAIDVKVSIPKDLPKSMFPLIFRLESSAASITPRDADNLPVTSGQSIAGGSKVAFQFIKTLSYEEYTDPSAIDGDQISFVCKFKTNKAASACTVYVENTFFNLAYDAFTNFHRYDFYGLAFSNSTASSIGTEILFDFSMVAYHVPPEVIIKLDGLVNDGDSRLHVLDADEGTYWLSTNDNTNISDITLKTSDGTGRYSVTISDSAPNSEPRYRTASLHSLYHFTNISFDNDKVLSSGTSVKFNFSMDTDKLLDYVKVTLSGLDSDDSNLTYISGDDYWYYTGGTQSHSISLKTSGSTGNYSVSLTDDAYVPASLHSAYAFSNLSFGSDGNETSINSAVNFTFNMVTGHVPAKVKVTLTGLTSNGDSNLQLISGNDYWYTTSSANGTLSLKTTVSTGKYGVALSSNNYYDASLKSSACYSTVTINTNTSTFTRRWQGGSYKYDLTETVSPATMTFASRSSINWDWSSSSDLYLSNGSVFTISSTKAIAKIEITYSSYYNTPNSVTTSPSGTYSESSSVGSWIPSSGSSPTSVQFTITNGYYSTRMSKVVITYEN